MGHQTSIAAIVGTYRKGGIIDSAIDEMLSLARESDAGISKIYRVDRNVWFGTNRRSCISDPCIVFHGREPREEVIRMDKDMDHGDGPDSGRLRRYVCGGIDCEEGWENQF